MQGAGGEGAGVGDLGGSIITGIDGNPLAVVARQMGIPMHEIASRCPLYVEGGAEAEKDVDEVVRHKSRTRHKGNNDTCNP